MPESSSRTLCPGCWSTGSSAWSLVSPGVTTGWCHGCVTSWACPPAKQLSQSPAFSACNHTPTHTTTAAVECTPWAPGNNHELAWTTQHTATATILPTGLLMEHVMGAAPAHTPAAPFPVCTQRSCCRPCIRRLTDAPTPPPPTLHAVWHQPAWMAQPSAATCSLHPHCLPAAVRSRGH